MKDILIEFKYTIDEAVHASMEGTKCISYIGFMPWAGIITLLFCATKIQMLGSRLSDMTAYIIVGIICTTTPLILRWFAKRKVLKLPNINKKVIWCINDVELKISHEGGESKFLWNQLIRICERKRGFLLFSQPNLAQWLPKNGFKDESDIMSFRDIVRDKSLFKKHVFGKFAGIFILYIIIATILIGLYYIFNTASGG